MRSRNSLLILEEETFLMIEFIVIILIDIGLVLIALFLLKKITLQNKVFKQVLTCLLSFLLFHLTYVLFCKLLFAENNWVEDSAPFGLIYGPFLYLLISSVRSKSFSRKRMIAHLSPFVLFLIVLIFFFAFGVDSTSHLAEMYMTVLYALVPVSLVSYSLWGLILIHFMEKIKGALYLFLMYFVLLSSVLSFYFFNIILSYDKLISDSSVSFNHGGMMMYSFLAFALVFLLIYLLQKLPGSHDIQRDEKERPPLLRTDVEEKKKETPSYNNTCLSDDILVAYEQKLDEYMEAHSPWKDQDLKLGRLAENLNMQRHHLTQVLNVRKKKNFNYYINEMRVNHVCKLMQNKKEGVSVEDVGYMSGFNSKSTYYRWFREIKQMTPAQYYELTKEEV